MSVCVLARRISTSLTRSQSLETSFSANCLQFMRFSIHPSSVGIEPGSVVGDNRCGSGALLVSMSIFTSIGCAWSRAPSPAESTLAVVAVRSGYQKKGGRRPFLVALERSAEGVKAMRVATSHLELWKTSGIRMIVEAVVTSDLYEAQ